MFLHGTGTSLGDPIEISAALSARGFFSDEQTFMSMLCNKSIVGHAEAGAGGVSLVYAFSFLNSLRYPAVLHLRHCNQHISSLIQHHGYPNAIEYRFDATRGVFIAANGTNKKIRKRNGGSAELKDNHHLTVLPPAVKTSIIERFPVQYQQLVFDTFYPTRD